MQFDPLPSFRTLTGAYEPSGIRQLPDGRFLIVEDEERHPLSLLSVHVDGSVRCTALEPPLLHPAAVDFWRLDDLEGVAIDRAGYLYAITSHSRNSAGDEEAAREKLVRFRIQGNRVVEPKVVTGLKRALRAEIDESAWASLYSTTSRPFPRPASGKIAVKVINHYGDEVLKVFAVG